MRTGRYPIYQLTYAQRKIKPAGSSIQDALHSIYVILPHNAIYYKQCKNLHICEPTPHTAHRHLCACECERVCTCVFALRMCWCHPYSRGKLTLNHQIFMNENKRVSERGAATENDNYICGISTTATIHFEEMMSTYQTN